LAWCETAKAVVVGNEAQERELPREDLGAEAGVVADVVFAGGTGVVGAGAVAFARKVDYGGLDGCENWEAWRGAEWNRGARSSGRNGKEWEGMGDG
jgi:hypothetical protein